MRTVVYIDAYPLINNPQAGIGQYTRELILQLAKLPDHRIILLLFKSDKDSTVPQIPGVEIEYLPLHRKVYSLVWKFLFPLNIGRLLRHPEARWVIYPNFGMTPFVRLRSAKTVTVIHDLTFLHYPETVEKRNRFFLRKAVQHSTRVSNFLITPSKYTARDLVDRFSVLEDRIRISYPGYAQIPISTVAVPQRLSKLNHVPFLLFLGTVEPRKNIPALCEAFLTLPNKRISSMKLVVAGRQGWGDVSIPSTESIVALGSVTNEEREWLLGSCYGFVFPSLFEGFGMPVMEAMRHKRPVVASLTSSLKEIISPDNALIIQPPFGAKDIYQQLEKLITEHGTEIEQKRIDRAYEDSLAFTWEATAQPFIELFKSSHVNSAE